MFETSVIAGVLQSELIRLRLDGRDCSVAELVDLVAACQSVVNQAGAVQALAMAHLAAIEDVGLEDGTVVEQHRGLGHQRLDAPALVSDQLGLSDAAAGSRVAAAVQVVTRTPGVFQAMGQGRLDGYRARIVTEELAEAPPEVCDQVVARVADSLGTEPPAVLRRRVRRVLATVDGDLLRDKAARARSRRALARWPGDEPGVDTWMGSFPVEQSRSAWAVVDGLARQYVRDGQVTGLEQARADALMDLVHSRATGTFVVQLAVPAHRTATDVPDLAAQPTSTNRPALRADQPAPSAAATGQPAAGDPIGRTVAPLADDGDLVTVTGLGMPGTTEVRRAWLESLIPNTTTKHSSVGAETGADGDAGAEAATQVAPNALREVVTCHADTGALLTVAPDLDPPDQPDQPRSRLRPRVRVTESKAYRPPAALIDLVRARDGRCRFPGCTVNARSCDLDHVTPWPAGPTHAANLMCLCRRHHRIKQTARWRVRIDLDATVTWTDPTGRLRTTLPLDFLQLDAQRSPAEGVQQQLPRESPQQSRVDSSGRDLIVQSPVDSPSVLWSAWEDELGYRLAVAGRHARRVRRHGHRAEADAGRLDCTTGLDAFTLDAALSKACAGRGRWPRGVRSTQGEPPF